MNTESPANTVIIQIVSVENPLEKLEIRGLGVNDQSFVISNITKSKEWRAACGETFEDLPEYEQYDADDRRKTFDFNPSDTLATADLMEYLEPLLLNKVDVLNAVNGEYLNQFIQPTSVVALPATVSKSKGSGTTQQFTATVLPAEANQGIVWSISAGTALSIDQQGLVTIGATTPNAVYTVTAKSQSDETVLDTCALTVTT